MRSKVEAVILSIAIVVGIGHRFSDDVFGHGTIESMTMYFIGGTLTYSLWSWLALRWAPRKCKPFVKAFTGVCAAHLINDAFYQGSMGWVDLIAIIGATAYLIYKLLKR